MRGAGIEPARLAAGDFESPASTNFTTRAGRRRWELSHSDPSGMERQSGGACWRYFTAETFAARGLHEDGRQRDQPDTRRDDLLGHVDAGKRAREMHGA